MFEIAGAVVGVLATAVLGWLAYVYKSKITYDIVSMDAHLSITDGNLSPGQGRFGDFVLTAEQITLRNRGFRDLRDLCLHLEHASKPIHLAVDHVSSISKNAVQIQHNEDFLEISIPVFPRGEKVVIQALIKGRTWGQHRDLRGTGGQYKISQESVYLAGRNGALMGFSFFATVWLIALASIGILNA